MMNKSNNKSSNINSNSHNHHHHDDEDKEIDERNKKSATATSKVQFALNQTVVINEDDGNENSCYGDDLCDENDLVVDNNNKNNNTNDAVVVEKENSGEITAASTTTTNTISIRSSRQSCCTTTRSSRWFTQDELQEMKDSDEFILTKQSYSRFARCKCCKGYKICRGFELRCPTNIQKRNTKISKCRSSVLDYYHHQNQKSMLLTPSSSKDDDESNNRYNKNVDVNVNENEIIADSSSSSSSSSNCNEDIKLAQKYSELCASDIKDAINIGRLDALQAQLLMETSWRSSNNNNNNNNNNNRSGNNNNFDFHDEEDETYIQLFPSSRYKNGDNDGDGSAISELSFDYNIQKWESSKKGGGNRKKGGRNILRRTGRSLLRAFKLKKRDITR